MTYIDQLKYCDFSRNPDQYLKNATVVNFDMIYKSIRGDDHKQKFSNEHYKTVYTSQLKNFPGTEKKKAFGVCLRSERKDLHVERKLTFSHFLNS